MKENKLLAEYLGLDIPSIYETVIGGVDFKGEQNSWHPDSDWNQLMLVVEKIEEEPEVQEVQIFKTTCNICDKIDDLVHTNRAMPRIEAVYNACVEYIKQK